MTAPGLISSVAEMRAAANAARKNGTLALVPTMGALHEGHLSLVRAARELCETVVVSIFVNPTQFAPNEDFARYPRSIETDLELLAREHVDFVFAPSAEQMYPSGAGGTVVEVPDLGDRLDGASRPGHFRGVATVVAKLFLITSPDIAIFGQKDAAQVALLRAMVTDLHFSVNIVVCPTVREPDGLAMSSRNRYLSPADRAHSLVLQRALRAAETAASQGAQRADDLRDIMTRELQIQSAISVEYAEVVDPDTLIPLNNVRRDALLAVAARVGSTRLIDNILLQPPQETPCE